jgi:hypothetical protein
MLVPKAERWKGRAAQVRRLAEGMGNDPARDLLLVIAKEYEEVAQRYSVATARVDKGGSSPSDAGRARKATSHRHRTQATPAEAAPGRAPCHNTSLAFGSLCKIRFG